MPAICVSPQTLCLPGTSSCASYPSEARVHLWVNATGNKSFLPWVQVVFVVETTVFDGAYDPTAGDYGGGGYGGVNGADPCSGPCMESDGVPYLVDNIGQITQGITEKNVGVTSSSHVTFSMVDYFSNQGADHDDGDGSEYNVDVSAFQPATSFATTVSSMASGNTLFGRNWVSSIQVYGDSDFSDNFLSSSMITALYGGLHGSGLSWVNNASTYHVVVLVGSTLPRDAKYQGSWCPTYNDQANACPDLSSTSEPAYTYGSGLSEPAGENISDIVTLAQQEHVLIDTIDLPDGMTEMGSRDYVNTSATTAYVAKDVRAILGAGCYLAQATGGSWEGPTPGYSGVGFTCAAAATHNSKGNLTNTFRPASGGSFGWSTNPALGWALTNVAFPAFTTNYTVIGWVKEQTFVFDPSTNFVIDPTQAMTFDCINNGTVVTSKCAAAANSSLGGGGWTWSWPYPAMYPNDMWSVSLTVNVSSTFNQSQLNTPVSVDACLNNTYWTGCPGPTSGNFYSWVQYTNITHVSVIQSFPPAFVDVASNGVVPSLASVSVSPPNATLMAGANQTFTAIPTCSGGTCPTGTSYYWSMTNASMGYLNTFTGPTVVFTSSGSTGSVALFVNATLYSVTQSSSPVPIAVSPSVRLSAVSVTPNPVQMQVNTSQGFSATPSCTGGTCASGTTYVWNLTNSLATLVSSTGSSVVVTAGASAGNVTLFVNATLSGTTVMSRPTNITITVMPPPTLASVAVTPTFAQLTVGQTANFTAVPLCGSQSCSPTPTYSWTLTSASYGSLNSNVGNPVMFSATAAGTVTLFVNATLRGTTVRSNPIPITVQAIPPLIGVTISPPSDTLPAGHVQSFAASPSCTGSCPTGITYFWTLTNSKASLNTSLGDVVTLTAGPNAGVVNVFVNASLGSVTRQSSPAPITITIASNPLTGVSVSPGSWSLSYPASTTFNASITCTSGPCPSGTVYSWSLTNLNYASIASATGSTAVVQSANATGTTTLFVNATLGNVTKMSAPVPISVQGITAAPVTLDSVTLSPGAPTVNEGATQVFTALPTCSATPCPTGITYGWKLSSSLGSLSAAKGVSTTFEAGFDPGKVTVTVSATLNQTTVNASTVVTIIGTSSGGGASQPTLPAGVVYLLVAAIALAAILLIFVLYRQRRRPAPPTPPTG